MNQENRFIEFIRIQKVRVPLNKEIDNKQFINFMNGTQNIYDYDGEIFDFDNEEIVEEEHSYMNNECKLVIDGTTKYEFKSPYQGYNLLKIK